MTTLATTGNYIGGRVILASKQKDRLPRRTRKAVQKYFSTGRGISAKERRRILAVLMNELLKAL